MNKKYQVFVSSTYDDLRVERQEVIHALLELDCIPSGMELFPAADDDQWSLIKDIIDECDYYILILGGRYGSLSPKGMGYTEMEYQYALKTEKPIIAFLHKTPNSLPKMNTENTPEGTEKFQVFRELVQNKMCKYWESAQELGSVVSRSLVSLQKRNPGVGWVRADLVPSHDLTLEILELKKEIERLKTQLDDERTKAPVGTEKLAQGTDNFVLNYKFSSTTSKSYTSHSWNGELHVTWDDIFYQLSPLMIHESNDRQLKESLNIYTRKLGLVELEKDKDFRGHTFSSFYLDEEDFQTIKVQLRALGLIKKSDKVRSVKDIGTYWSLTAYGDSVMNRLRAIPSEVDPLI
ncbi:hypothetical protein BZ17_719 [Yersinia pseudotuberculosis IP 32953]|uniref:DUF4062 domain-containing protein n=2 Tax=Yersinia TaxID=629 RepID=Q66BJ6_YERPS|nr:MULTISPECIES: DUF4062 domain-containing protein [Yersinia]EKN6116705.1 DUF4062 domain-containing protein [Yersinia enterocolitica]AJJ54412.1 hypothetical protein BZ17_719 [Yersinia pseudotuberculosis IP 32953]CAH21014.1 hypothetical [Yersinia pseudotuberculosis IP 32953]CNI71087.1 Uncharacterised protein [Yersinia mollaretii]HDL8127071.1 DUF4062 domain-containing protein [Yersinia enterocolitica]